MFLSIFTIFLLLMCSFPYSLDAAPQYTSEYQKFVKVAEDVRNGTKTFASFVQEFSYEEEDMGVVIEALHDIWKRSKLQKQKNSQLSRNLFQVKEEFIALSSSFGSSEDKYYTNLRVEIKANRNITATEKVNRIELVQDLKKFHLLLQKIENYPSQIIENRAELNSPQILKVIKTLERARRVLFEESFKSNSLTEYDILRYQFEKKYGIAINGVLPEQYIKKYIAIKKYKVTGNSRNMIISKLLNDMGKITLGGFFVMGALSVAPESVSGWSSEQKDSAEISQLADKYNKNVKNGPVIDEDELYLNYFGHPVTGGWYYMFARKKYGMSPLQSFFFSALVSTFWWEYGLESFAETPSWQDIFVTPIIGSICGELFYKLDKMIEANDGKLFGSEIAGKTVQVLVYPLEYLVDGSDYVEDKINVDIGGQFIFENIYDRDLDENISVIGFKVVITHNL